jgi:Tfp pilus assembly protein PilF
MSTIYASKFENELAIQTLEDGLKLNPDQSFLTNDYINLLLDNEKYEQAQKAITNSMIFDNQNKLLYFLSGYLNQTKNRNNTNAQLAYHKALEIDENYFDALYQLSLVYISTANEALQQKNQEQFKAYINRAEFILIQANEININDRNTIQLLIEIYTRKNRLDKVQELKRKITDF